MCKLAHATTLTQQRALDAVDHASRHRPETSITLDRILRKFDRDVIQDRRIWMPKLRRIHTEHEGRATASRSRSLHVLCMRLVDCNFDRAVGVRATVHGNIDCAMLL